MPKRSLKPGNGESKKIEQLNRAWSKCWRATMGESGSPGPRSSR